MLDKLCDAVFSGLVFMFLNRLVVQRKAAVTPKIWEVSLKICVNRSFKLSAKQRPVPEDGTLHYCLYKNTRVPTQTQWCRYLERCRACVLSADGVSIVGPHDLINPVAFERQRLLRRHHAQFLQLQEETLLSTLTVCASEKCQPTFWATTFTLYVCSLNMTELQDF